MEIKELREKVTELQEQMNLNTANIGTEQVSQIQDEVQNPLMQTFENNAATILTLEQIEELIDQKLQYHTDTIINTRFENLIRTIDQTYTQQFQNLEELNISDRLDEHDKHIQQLNMVND